MLLLGKKQILKPLFYILIFFLVQTSFAQSNKGVFSKLSRPEKCWAFFHPFVAKKAHRITMKVQETAKEVAKDPVLDQDENGGQVDAFRHAYWMALLSQRIKAKKALKLGKAHERGNHISFKRGEYEEGAPPDSMGSVMDLYNNCIGSEIGRNNKKIKEEELKQLVLRSIFQGNMRILKKDPKGNYLDCSGKIIDLVSYRGKWSVPKCLVGSSAQR